MGTHSFFLSLNPNWLCALRLQSCWACLGRGFWGAAPKVPLITQAAYAGQARHERGNSTERFKESGEETLPRFHFVPFTPLSFTPPPPLPYLLQMWPPSGASQVLCHLAQSPLALLSFWHTLNSARHSDSDKLLIQCRTALLRCDSCVTPFKSAQSSAWFPEMPCKGWEKYIKTTKNES